MERSFKSEIGRKMLHLSALLLLALYLIVKNILLEGKPYAKEAALFVLMLFLLGSLIYEYLRLNLKWKLPLSELTRLRERNKHTGMVYMISGMILSLAVFEENIAFAAILMAIFGDFVVGIMHGARVVGFYSGQKKRKAYELLIEFIVNFIVGIVILHNFWVIFLMALTATVVEMLFDSEDNLAIPVFAGALGQVLYWLIK